MTLRCAAQLFAVLVGVRGITGKLPVHTVRIDGRKVVKAGLARLVEICLADVPQSIRRVHHVALNERDGGVVIWVSGGSSGFGTLTRPHGGLKRAVDTSVTLQTLDGALLAVGTWIDVLQIIADHTNQSTMVVMAERFMGLAKSCRVVRVSPYHWATERWDSCETSRRW